MSWKRNDGQLALLASIASLLRQAGLPASEAEQLATRKALELRDKEPGSKHYVHAGDTVIEVTVK